MEVDQDTIRPCAHCGHDYLTMYVNRCGKSFLKCDYCTSQVSYDGTNCSDPDTGQIIKVLIEAWNRRPDE